MSTSLLPTDVTATSMSFEEKLKQRLRDSVGEMLTDDDLKKIVDKGFQDLFFAERPNPRYASSSYGSNEPRMLPSLIQSMLKDLLMTRMDEALKQYLKDNPQQVQEAMQAVLTNGAGVALMGALNTQFSSHFYNMFQTIASQYKLPMPGMQQ